jgi:hypothetical protein
MSLEDALRFDKAACDIALVRMKSSPIDLTEQDFDQLAIVSSRLADDAYEARRLAQLAIVEQHKAQTSTPIGDLPMEELATVVVDTIKRAIEPLQHDIQALRDEHADLKGRVLELEASRAAAAVDR